MSAFSSSTSPAAGTAAQGLTALLVSSGDGTAPGLGAALAERGLAVEQLALAGADPAAVERELAAAAGGDAPDVVINLLGPAAPGVGSEDLATDVWCEALDRALTRTLLTCQRFGAGMLARRGGVIVTVLHGDPDDAAAGVLDAGATGLMRVLGVEWAPEGVRVVTVVPDGVPGAERDDAVADTIAFLAGSEASFVTASELVVRTPATVGAVG